MRIGFCESSSIVGTAYGLVEASYSFLQEGVTKMRRQKASWILSIRRILHTYVSVQSVLQSLRDYVDYLYEYVRLLQ